MMAWPCWHKWTKWEDGDLIRTTYPLRGECAGKEIKTHHLSQSRECEKCGKKQIRTINTR